MRKWLGIAALLFGLTACTEEPFFEKNVPLDNSSWPQGLSVNVEVDVPTAGAAYDLFINIRNTKDYGYMNLHMFLDIVDPDGQVWKDTLEFLIADETGKWTGESSGTHIMNSFLTYEGFKFEKSGKYTFQMRHGMFDPTLPEITDVGVRLEQR